MTYTYDPTKITDSGKDQMRFELGDTLVDGGVNTCALSDEEYSAILEELKPGKMVWLHAKKRILEAILFKMSYMVDTKIDTLSYGLGERAKTWQKLYDKLCTEITASTGIPTMDENAARKKPYFHTGMDDNPCTILNSSFPFRRMFS